MPKKQFFCTKCKIKHLVTSKIGKQHKAFQEISPAPTKPSKAKAKKKIVQPKIPNLPDINKIKIPKKGFGFLSSSIILICVAFFMLMLIYCSQVITLAEFDNQSSLISGLRQRLDDSKYSTTSLVQSTSLATEGEGKYLPTASWSTDGSKFIYLTTENGKYISHEYNLLTKENTVIETTATSVPEGLPVEADFPALIFTANSDHAAWVELQNGVYRAFVVEKNKAIADKIELGEVNGGANSQDPILSFSADENYLISYPGGEVFAFKNRETVLAKTDDQTTHKVEFAPGGEQLLIITNSKDKLAEGNDRHELAQIKVVDLIDLTETEIFASTGERGTDDALIDLDATWSPDGEYIIYSYNQQLWLVRADGERRSQLTKTALAYREPRWSPAGDKIITRVDNDIYLIDLHVRDIFSKKTKPLVFSGHALSAKTTPAEF